MSLVALCNLGCSKNQIDGSNMLEYLCRCGYTYTDDFSKAHVIVVNTCAFIKEAKQEAIDTILEMALFKKSGACAKLIVCGCFSQRFRGSVEEQFPEVDVWAGIDDWPRLFERHLGASAKPSYVRKLEKPVATQYVKISEGCSHACAFCAIPRIRGEFRSRAVSSIVEEAKWLYGQGARECILVSQDTSNYGRDGKSSLNRLLEQLLADTAFPWIRMMYLHPALVGDDLLNLVAGEPRLCPYFDIPLQHGADPILAAMKRRPLSKGNRRLVERIRTTVPDAAIRTTFIVGFPGETEGLFEELLAFVEEMKFDKVGVFPFSPEEGTAAYAMHPRPRDGTVARRCEALMTLQREISETIGLSRVGRTVECIIDNESNASGFAFEGRTRWDAPDVDGKVFIKNHATASGPIVRVRITGADDYDLFGEIERSLK
ncbi:MAG: 30S ribosomal protein S12 methylthiotransferase RimO [Chitinivibrionales bacterium]